MTGGAGGGGAYRFSMSNSDNLSLSGGSVNSHRSSSNGGRRTSYSERRQRDNPHHGGSRRIPRSQQQQQHRGGAGQYSSDDDDDDDDHIEFDEHDDVIEEEDEEDEDETGSHDDDDGDELVLDQEHGDDDDMMMRSGSHNRRGLGGKRTSMVGSMGKFASQSVMNTTKFGKGLSKTTKLASHTVLDTTAQASKLTKQAGKTVGKSVKNAGNMARTSVVVTGKMATSSILEKGQLVLQATGINHKNKNKGLHRKKNTKAWIPRLTAEDIKIDLKVECRRIPKKDTFTQADAFGCLWEVPVGYNCSERVNSSDASNASKRSRGSKSSQSSAAAGPSVSRLPTRQEQEVGRTEVVRSTKNPTFKHTFRLVYKFNQEQPLVLRVYDEDLRYATDLKEHDYIGGCMFTLAEVMGSTGCCLARPLSRSSKAYVVLTGTEIVETREVLEYRFSGQGLGLLEKKSNVNMAKEIAKGMADSVQKLNVAKQVIEKFHAYFQLEKLNEDDQSWIVVWKSEVVKDNQNPTWNMARLPLQLLCDDDPEKQIRVTIWDWNRFGANDACAGSVECTVADLVRECRRGIPVLDVMQERKKFFGGYKLQKAGVLKVLKSQIVYIPSMLQYMAGGCELHTMIAVDCTSTGNMGKDWRSDECYHYREPGWWNDYQAAIQKIGNLFMPYEGRFTMWGYGGNIRNMPHKSIPMGENMTTTEELLEAYNEMFAYDNFRMTLGQNADLQHVIQTAMFRSIQVCKKDQAQQNGSSNSNQNRRKTNSGGSKKQCYSTLVILTTGEIDDLQENIDVICTAAEDAPLSIVVIGIGEDYEDANKTKFAAFQHLAGSGRLRHSNGVPIARDIVSCSTFAEYDGNASACVSDALSEVPEQLVQYFTECGSKPLPPKAQPDFSRDTLFGKNSGHSAGSRSKSKNDNDSTHNSTNGDISSNGGSLSRGSGHRNGASGNKKNNSKRRSKTDPHDDHHNLDTQSVSGQSLFISSGHSVMGASVGQNNSSPRRRRTRPASTTGSRDGDAGSADGEEDSPLGSVKGSLRRSLLEVK